MAGMGGGCGCPSLYPRQAALLLRISEHEDTAPAPPDGEGLSIPSLRKPCRVPAGSLRDTSGASQATDPILQCCSKGSNGWVRLLQQEVRFLTVTSQPSRGRDHLALSLRGLWFLPQ